MTGIESNGSDAASGSSSGHCSPGFSGIADDHSNADQRDRLSSISSTSTTSGPLSHSVEEFSSNCSETSASPASDCGDSRRPSTSDGKDEHYYERRKRNNDASKKSREKRRLNDMAMEQRLLELTKENNLLKSRLESQHRVNTQAESVIVAGPSVLAHPTPTAPPEISMDQSSSMLPHLFINPYLQSAVQPPVSAPSIQSSSGSAFTAPSSSIAGSNGTSNPPPGALNGYGAFTPYGSVPKLDLAGANLPAPMSIFPSHFFNTSSLLTAANGGLNAAAGAMPLSLHSLSTLHAALQQHNGQAYRSATSGLFSSEGAGAFQPFSTAAAAAASQPSQSGKVESSSRTSQPSESTRSTSRKVDREEKRQGSPDSSSDKELISSTSSRMPQEVSKGPGNLRFVGQLPVAQEPRPSVLSHIANSSNFWPSSSSLPTSTIVPTSAALSSSAEPQLPQSSAFSRSAPTVNTTSLGVLVNGNHSAAGNFSASNGAPSAFDSRIVSAMSNTSDRSQPSLLGSLLSATRRSPSVPESRTERQSGLAGSGRREDESELKNCLSTLNVNLSSSTSSSFSSSSANNGGAKSDSDSLGSPQSTKSTTDSNRSQSSPTHATNSSGSPSDGAKGRPDMERFQYMDRRRRNNEAAKRCRANRRAVFEYRSRRAQQLEIENGELRQEMFKLNQELEQLKSIIAANARLLPTT